MWPQHRMTVIFVVYPWHTLHLCQQCWVDIGVLQWIWNCFYELFLTEGWNNVSHDVLSASIVQKLPDSRLQWARERRQWRAERKEVVCFSGEHHSNLSYNDGRIRVRCYWQERNFLACVVERHNGLMRSVNIGFSLDTICDITPLPCIQGNLNSNHYIMEVLEPKKLHILNLCRTRTSLLRRIMGNSTYLS